MSAHKWQLIALLTLVCVLGLVSGPMGLPVAEAEASQEKISGDGEAIETLLALLHQRWDVKLTDAEIKESLTAVAGQEDEVVERVMEGFYSPSSRAGYHSRTLRVLGAMRTPAALESLRGIVLTTTDAPPSLRQHAAMTFLASIEDRSEARALLASSDAGIKAITLKALTGQPLDETLWQAAREGFLSEGSGPEAKGLRMVSAAVLAEDPGSALAEEKTQMILDAIRNVWTRPDADKFLWSSYYTLGEDALYHYIRCLAAIQGADDALEAASRAETGFVRDSLAIARAQRGDASVRPQITRILKAQERGHIRAWAAECLSVIGTEEDLPLLRDLESSDPFEPENKGDLIMGEPIYPVRSAAARSIKAIQARSEVDD